MGAGKGPGGETCSGAGSASPRAGGAEDLSRSSDAGATDLSNRAPGSPGAENAGDVAPASAAGGIAGALGVRCTAGGLPGSSPGGDNRVIGASASREAVIAPGSGCGGRSPGVISISAGVSSFTGGAAGGASRASLGGVRGAGPPAVAGSAGAAAAAGGSARTGAGLAGEGSAASAAGPGAVVAVAARWTAGSPACGCEGAASGSSSNAGCTGPGAGGCSMAAGAVPGGSTTPAPVFATAGTVAGDSGPSDGATGGALAAFSLPLGPDGACSAPESRSGCTNLTAVGGIAGGTTCADHLPPLSTSPGCCGAVAGAVLARRAATRGGATAPAWTRPPAAAPPAAHGVANTAPDSAGASVSAKGPPSPSVPVPHGSRRLARLPRWLVRSPPLAAGWSNQRATSPLHEGAVRLLANSSAPASVRATWRRPACGPRRGSVAASCACLVSVSPSAGSTSIP